MSSTKVLHMVAFLLVIIGALNWGLYGAGWLFVGNDTWNVVHMILGAWPQVEWVIYILVGLSGLWLAVTHKKDCKMCMSK